MKRILLFAGLLIISLAIFNSCKKDNAKVTSNNNNNLFNDSNFLLRQVMTDSTAASEDTVGTLTYSYDNLQRVINVLDSQNTPIGIQLNSVTDYYYNVTEVLPYKSVRIHTDGPNFHDTINQFFFYDAMGKRTKDSIIETSFGVNNGTTSYIVRYILKTYQNTATNIYGYSRDTTIYALNGYYPLAPVYFDTANLDGNGNIMSSVKRPSSVTFELQTAITNTNLQNVFYRLNIRGCFNVFPEYHAIYNNYGTSNNPSHIVQQYSNSATVYQSDLIYTYNSNGFVQQTTATDAVYAGTYNKTLFYYGPL